MKLAQSWLGLIAVALAAQALAPSASAAQSDRDFGLGLIIGDPTGLSMKGFLSEDTAIDGAVGVELIGGDALHVHADFLWQFDIKQWESAALDLYLGVGPTLGFHDGKGRDRGDHDDDGHLHLGARGPFGLAVMFNPARFDVFLEVAAKLHLIDKVRFGLDAAIGGRYWF